MSNFLNGGAFQPAGDYAPTGEWDFSDATVTFPSGTVESGGSIALTDLTNQMVTGQGSNLTTVTFPASSGAVTVTMPSTTSTVATLAGTETLTNKTITGAINSDFRVLAATADYDNTTVLATLTGWTWTLVAGTYAFQIELPSTMTTNGGLAVAFTYTTLVMTSIRVNTYQSTAADNSTAVSATSTTTTSATKFINNKDAAYTINRLSGSFVVGTGGTLAVQAAQNTGATGADASHILIGAWARITRVA